MNSSNLTYIVKILLLFSPIFYHFTLYFQPSKVFLSPLLQTPKQSFREI